MVSRDSAANVPLYLSKCLWFFSSRWNFSPPFVQQLLEVEQTSTEMFLPDRILLIRSNLMRARGTAICSTQINSWCFRCLRTSPHLSFCWHRWLETIRLIISRKSDMSLENLWTRERRWSFAHSWIAPAQVNTALQKNILFYFIREDKILQTSMFMLE